MGEKDHSDKQLDRRRRAVLSRRCPPSTRVRARVRRIRVERAALLADVCRLNTLYMIMQAGSGPHRLELQLDGSDHVAVDRGARRHQQRRRRTPTRTSRRRATTRRRCTRCSSRSRSSTSICCIGCAGFGGLPGHPDVDDAVHRDQHRLARHGHLEGVRHGARAARSRGRGGRIVRDDRRRRAAGRADLGIAAAGRQRTARRDHRDRRSQQAPVGLGGVGGQRSRADRGQVPRLRLGSAARRRPRLPRDPATSSRDFATVTDRPKVLIADTIKGKGVSFMEGLACGDQTYHFHAGAPSLEGLSRGGRAS